MLFFSLHQNAGWMFYFQIKQFFSYKNTFLLLKTGENIFLRNKTLNQRFDANLKNPFFAKFCCKFLAFFSFFSFLPLNMFEIKISTSVLNVQHLNAG